MTKEKHTPLPWDVDTQKIQMGYGSGLGKIGKVTTYAVVDGSGAVICETSNSDLTTVEEETDEDDVNAWDAQGEANTAFIVKACNSHYELLERLRLTNDSLDMVAAWGKFEDPKILEIIQKRIDGNYAAIAKAEAA
jgi:hypothetical protein